MPASVHKLKPSQSDSSANAEELMVQTQCGSERAFEQLIGGLQHALYDFLLRRLRQRADADDAFQETVIRVWRFRENYRPGHSVRAYIIQIASRVALELQQRQRKHRSLQEGPLATPSSEPHGSEIEAAIAALPEPERSVLCLRRIQQFSILETAEALGLTERAVEYRLSCALELLRKQLAVRGEQS